MLNIFEIDFADFNNKSLLAEKPLILNHPSLLKGFDVDEEKDHLVDVITSSNPQ